MKHILSFLAIAALVALPSCKGISPLDTAKVALTSAAKYEAAVKDHGKVTAADAIDIGLTAVGQIDAATAKAQAEADAKAKAQADAKAAAPAVAPSAFVMPHDDLPRAFRDQDPAGAGWPVSHNQAWRVAVSLPPARGV